MAILKITQDDVNRTLPPDAGWHLFRVDKFSDSPSKDKGSTNYVFECVIVKSLDPTNHKNVGRYGFARFNSKMMGALVASGFLPAVFDRPIDEGIELDPDQTLGKEFWGNIKDDTYEGKIQKRLEEFAPVSNAPQVPF